MHYYNEIDKNCVQWLASLMDAGMIPRGHIDDRSIEVVEPSDLRGFSQCHFFAGIAGWPLALQLAGWLPDRPIWTGSCPCQPFSVAGKRKGVADPRHLWPHFHRLIRAARPPVVMGEQVSGKAGYAWLDGVGSDLESEDYTFRAVDIPACAVNTPHRRNRLYWVAHGLSPRLEGRTSIREDAGTQCAAIERGGYGTGGVAHTEDPYRGWEAYQRDSWRRTEETGRSGHMAFRMGDPKRQRDEDAGCRAITKASGRMQSTNGQWERIWANSREPSHRTGFWDDFLLIGPDQNARFRRIKPGIPLLAHGVPVRVAKLRALGNAIVPQLAAEVIRAYMETEGCMIEMPETGPTTECRGKD